MIQVDETSIATAARRNADAEISGHGARNPSWYSVELALERAFMAGARFVQEQSQESSERNRIVSDNTGISR
jgi:hypothetical protein